MNPTSPKNIAIGVLGAAVLGLGGVVAADHFGASSASPAALTASSTSTPHRGMGHAFPAFGGAASMSRVPIGTLLQKIQQDIGLSIGTIVADMRSGKTLNQIAGANAAKVQADIVAAVKAELDKAVAKHAITAADETRVLADVTDEVSVLMNAHLSDLTG
jgi:hypothetical protein